MSLVRFVCAASLLAVGLTALSAPELTTDERRYDGDEPVVFTLENDSPNVLGWGSFGRHPAVYRKLASGKLEAVYGLPDVMDEAAVMLPAGEEAQWVWFQTMRGDGEDEDGAEDGGDDPDIAVGEPNPNADLEPAPTRMPGAGPHVIAGTYVATFETFEEVYTSQEFLIRGPLSVDPVGKAAVTWASLKARR